MMRALLAVRLRGLGAMFAARGKKGKSRALLFVVLYLYLAVVMCGAMVLLFQTLGEVYHAQGLDWLYFSVASLMALGFSIIGGVFTTQNQLYAAQDNELLLSMPVKPGMILMSRMLSLLLFTFVFAGVVMLPAIAVYAISFSLSLAGILLQLLTLVALTLLAQAVCCLLGWLLHLLLSRMNKSAASMLYMIVFMGCYFYIYSQAGNIMQTMAASGASIGSALRSWAWPLYAAGMGCSGKVLYFLSFVLVSAALFGAAYLLLARTFLSTVTTQRSSRRRRLRAEDMTVGSIGSAIVSKELRRFLGCPVYLTNMGFGLLMEVAVVVAAAIFRGKIRDLLDLMTATGFPAAQFLPLGVCVVFSFICAMNAVSTPSVSLEGKSIWILKSMPVSSRRILEEKVRFHILITVPLTAVCSFATALLVGCSPLSAALCSVVLGVLSVLNGVFGMLCGLKWARLDWLSEAYPCKQSVGVLVLLLSMMVLPIMLGFGFYKLVGLGLTVTLFLLLTAGILALLSLVCYYGMITWGVKQWESL